jgi:hypothetical protein
MASDLPQPPPEAQDIFSLSDQVLADTLQFVTEVRTRSFGLRSGWEHNICCWSRLALGTGVPCGYVVLNVTQRHHLQTGLPGCKEWK